MTDGGALGITEHTLNDALAAVLRETRSEWRSSRIVSSENTGMLKGTSARPDILVVEPNVSPVVIETEVLPAVTVETDAQSRLGKQLRVTGRPILSAIAVRMPERLRRTHANDLRSAFIAAKDLELALLTGRSEEAMERWPSSGWIRGGIIDLSLLAQRASVPPAVIDAAADRLVAGVSESAGLLTELLDSYPKAVAGIASALCQEDGEQTRRMATTIMANAFIFHDTLANGPGALASVPSLDQLRGRPGGLSKSAIITAWRAILAINYWPIFDIARRLLEVVPPSHATALIERLADTATDLLEHSLMRSHDLTGAVFQRLIVDRKFLAAYYTTPASAAMLIGLAIDPRETPARTSWAEASNVTSLRVADFACGTGTLLSTAYQRIGQLHEFAGGDAASIHAEMMLDALIGCDVLPAAAHLTASMLAGSHPLVRYENSSILTVAYGELETGNLALGSLDLLDPQGILSVLDITAKAAGGMGEHETAAWLNLKDASVDLVVMNPPFTRPTGHEGAKVGVPVPMFAGLGVNKKTQLKMSKHLSHLTHGTSAHGNAGEASTFMVLADRKLKKGGTLALVLPFSLVSGEAWEGSRLLLRKGYSDIVVVSIAAAEDARMSFSADTGMGECLVVARKRTGNGSGDGPATFVSLRESPDSTLMGAAAAEQVRVLRAGGEICTMEEGPVGGTELTFGTARIGDALRASLPAAGAWSLGRIADFSLAQTAHQIVSQGRLWLPSMRKAQAPTIAVSTIGRIGKVGPYHMDVKGTSAAGGIRGPFKIAPLSGGRIPTYPVLWGHAADRERCMTFEAESEGIPLVGKTARDREAVRRKVEQVAATASHCHFNRDLRFNSQSTAMQFSRRKAVGGRAWLSISLPTEEMEKVLVLWGNSTIGLLMYWWAANRQQSGRGSIGKSVLPTLVTLDVTKLKDGQTTRAVKLFDALSTQPLKCVNEMDADPVRAALDAGLVGDVLGLGPEILGALDLLRKKLAAEPSIQGGKHRGGALPEEDETDA